MRDLVGLPKIFKTTLSVNESFALLEAVEDIEWHLRQSALPKLSEDEADVVVAALCDRKTVRDVILMGQLCRLTYRRTVLRQLADSENKVAIEKNEAAVRDATHDLKQYSKKANQSSTAQRP